MVLEAPNGIPQPLQRLGAASLKMHIEMHMIWHYNMAKKQYAWIVPRY
jgi:hypothetical protein